MPLFGLLADWLSSKMKGLDEVAGVKEMPIGIKTMMQLSALYMIFASIPAFWLISVGRNCYLLMYFGLWMLVIGISAFGAVLPSYLVYSVKNHLVRYTVLGLAYNISSMCFAGTTPVIQTFLAIAAQEDELFVGFYPSVYIAFTALMSLICQIAISNISSCPNNVTIGDTNQQLSLQMEEMDSSVCTKIENPFLDDNRAGTISSENNIKSSRSWRQRVIRMFLFNHSTKSTPVFSRTLFSTNENIV